MLEFAHQEHIKSYYFDSRNQTFELPPLAQQEEADDCARRRESRIWCIW